MTSLKLMLTGLLGLAAQNVPTLAQATPPNFVVIFTDDVGYGDLGCYGSDLATPRIDQLAAEGQRWTSFYSAAPTCSPSRAGLLTGCYPPRVSLTKVLFPRDDIGLHDDEQTVAEILRDRGYATACVGKWHLGHHPQFLPTRHGFDEYFGIPYSNDMDKVEGKDGNRDRTWRERDFTPWNVPLLRGEEEIERPADQTTITRRYTEEAVDFIQRHRERPFFLYFAHTMPHIPLFVDEPFHVDDPMKAYAATMAEIDASVGRVVDAVDGLGLGENTLIVFTSDNGPWLAMKHHGGSAKPLRDGKFNTWEGGVRVPAIFRWKGRIAAGVEIDEVGSTIDLLTTFSTLSGAALPEKKIDGGSLEPLLLGQPGATSPHEYFCYFKGVELEAVRRGRYKLKLRHGKNLDPHLFDLEQDIGESNNLATELLPVTRSLAAWAGAFNAAFQLEKRPSGKKAKKSDDGSP